MAMVGIPRLLRRLPHDVLRLRVRRTTPGKPPTGYIDLYADATGAIAGVDDAGAALSIGGGGGASIANGGGTLAFDGSGKLTGAAASGQDIRLVNADGAGIIAAGATGDTTIYGASDASVRAKGDDGVESHGGPSGSAHVDIEADGDVTINATPGKDIKLVNLPTSDPSVTDAVWLDGGVLVKSGSTVPSGGGSMSSFTLAGDGGSSQTINDGNTLTVAGGAGLASTAGATDTVTVDLDINSLTADASPDGAADYVATWDASASAHKKVLLNNLPGGGSGAVATDTIWDAAGDLAVGTGANTAAKLTMGSALQVLRVNAGGTALEYAAPSGGSGLYSAYLCYQDQKTQNTDSGAFTSGAWRTRDLNTEVADTGSHGSVASNQITLAAGTYRIHARAMAYNCARHQLRWQNVTDASTTLTGMSTYAGSNSSTLGDVGGRFTIASSKTFELQHRCETTQATFGFGVPSNFGGEIYATVELFKEA